jgi:hypothetical protein
MIYVSLKEKLMGEDEHKKLMATQMISKFEKYWFEFNEALVIAVILDPCYKLHLVNYYYTKIYRIMDSLQFENVHKKLKSLYREYGASSNTSSSSSSSIASQRPQVPRPKLAWQKVNNIINLLPS